MINETFQFIQSNTEMIIAIFTIVLAIVAGVAILVSIWSNYRTPQAIQAKIENNRYIQQERQKHYARLNTDIFEPLSLIIAQNKNPQRNIIGMPQTLNDKLILYYDISKIIHDSFYNLACLHFDKHFSGMSKEISLLNNNISRYNEETEIFIKNITNEISDKIQKYAKIADNIPSTDGQIYVPRVMDFLIDKWWYFIQEHKRSKKPIATIIAENKLLNERRTIPFEGKIDNEVCEYILKTQREQMGFINVVPPENENEIVSILESYCTNQKIILRLIEITNHQTELIKKSKEIANNCKIISDQIANERYDTKVRGCLDKDFLRNV